MLLKNIKSMFHNLFNLDEPMSRKEFWTTFWIFPLIYLICSIIFFIIFIPLHLTEYPFLFIENTFTYLCLALLMMLFIRRGIDTGMNKNVLYSWVLWTVLFFIFGMFGLVFWFNVIVDLIILCLPSHYFSKNNLEH